MDKKRFSEKVQKQRIKLQQINLWKLILLVAIALLAVFFISRVAKAAKKAPDFVDDYIIGHEGKVTTITESSLMEVLEISELSTVEYPYNAIVHVYNGEGTEVEYHVAYEGTIRAGIDFEKVEVGIDQEKKIITLKIPDCEVQNTSVDFGSMEYIFVNAGAETETVSQEAYKACQKDLKERSEEDPLFLEMARENAVIVVKALMEPWVKQLDDEYKVVIR